MPTCGFITLGCKVNQYDTQAIRESLARLGYEEVPPRAAADLYVVNTCCVTQESHRKSLQHVRRIAREHPAATLVVTGCSVESDADEIRAIPGVCCLVGNDAKPLLAELFAETVGTAPSHHAPWSSSAARLPELSVPKGRQDLAGGFNRRIAGTQTDQSRRDDRPPVPWPTISSFAGHTRAFVKIEDGCNSYCSYCIVPYVRGRIRSRPAEDVVAEVRRLVENGYREVVLTGIHLGAYGRDVGGAGKLVPLLEELEMVRGLLRIRLSSLELREVTDDLLLVVSASNIVCGHFHIPLQSGDDHILRAMNRRYTAGRFLSRLEEIRERVLDPAITTDIIVGFPGETDAQFRRTIEVARQAAFGRVHVFPYSDRAGTRAARMPDKVPKETIDVRRREMLAVARELSRAFHEHFIGHVVSPLVETQRDRQTGLLCGYTDDYVRAFFEGPDDLRGKIAQVLVREAGPRGVLAEIHNP